MSNVKLAIRVRPFTDRELRKQKERAAVVSVLDDHTVTITNVKVSTCGAGDSRVRVRRYTADYTFDSTQPDQPGYASQDTLFSTVGRDVLSSLLGGRSTCVLAYGQSSTGKTYTMMGGDYQPGLVPRLCEALAREGREITVSFLEIYNERVHDLLGENCPAPAQPTLATFPPNSTSPPCASLPRRTGNTRKDLRVREHPVRGTYVQNLRRVVVNDVTSLLTLVQQGTSQRRTAATRRNNTSSRSHALLELATSRGTLHLADLAGSEKASWDGSGGGGRQKEGANINKSLVALSNVISALVNAGSSRSRFVPYRDSALTWLLRDCFTGGANTFIIATVSPSAECYGESASTLRWAARARQLPASRPPLHPPQATRAALQTQLTGLLEELARQYIRYVPESGKIYYEDTHWTLNPNSVLKAICCFEEQIEVNPENEDDMDKALDKHSVTNSESTASSVASGSSDKINVIDKNVRKEINEEMDKLFGPALERARSGTDLKVVAPHRNKRRQYRSQEVLPIYKTVKSERINTSSNSLNSKDLQKTVDTKAEKQESEEQDSSKNQHVPIFYDNQQRAEIVASVTERLYNKLKKKEESAVAKVEAVVDKKIMEPLSELRICTNARQRLMELSQKALRNKRRIGIPAYTQTRKQVSRVREQAVDVQQDLEPFYIKERFKYTPHQDVSTETVAFTPRCKETAAGPKFGSINYKDMSTLTDENKSKYKNSSAMTDELLRFDRCTQTPVVPPPRKKKQRKASTYSKYINNRYTELVETPIININISQTCEDESDSQPSSEDSLEVRPIPDLITNHDKIEVVDVDDDPIPVTPEPVNEYTFNHSAAEQSAVDSSPEFPSEEHTLPRVTASSTSPGSKEMEDIILGRNDKMYPYNIVLSPPRERETVRTVKFKDEEVRAFSLTSHNIWDSKPAEEESSPKKGTAERYNGFKLFDKSQASSSTDSTDSGKVESDKFYWKPMTQGSKSFYEPRPTSLGCNNSRYSPVYKTGFGYTKRNNSAKSKCYKEFLGLDKDETSCYSSDDRCTVGNYDDIDRTSREDFKKKRQFFEENLEQRYNDSFAVIEKNILKSCDQLEYTVNKYDKYLKNCNRRKADAEYKPSEYLQHLVRLRRDFIKVASDTESTTSGYTDSVRYK